MTEFAPEWFDAVSTGLLELLKTAGVPEFAMPECGSKILSEMYRWTDNRSIKHFSHDYLVAIRRLQVEEGGGYIACIPQLGLGCFHGDGETPEEALNHLEDLYAELRELWADDPDVNWEEPKTEDNIQWNDKPPLSAEEIGKRFKELLAEVNRKELASDKG